MWAAVIARATLSRAGLGQRLTAPFGISTTPGDTVQVLGRYVGDAEVFEVFVNLPSNGLPGTQFVPSRKRSTGTHVLKHLQSCYHFRCSSNFGL